MEHETADYEILPNESEAAQRPPAGGEISPYAGVSLHTFTQRALEALAVEVDPEAIEVRPDGLIYLPGIHYRRKLNEAFGPGCWGMLPRGIDVKDGVMCYVGVLFVNGQFIAEAIGEADYTPGGRTSYATAAESAKSNCLLRCCKDLGYGSELWEPKYVRDWLAKYAVQVWCKTKEGKSKQFWRRKDAPPIDAFPWKEGGHDGGDNRRGQQRPQEHAPAPSPTNEAPKPSDARQSAGAAPSTASPTPSSRPFPPERLRAELNAAAEKLDAPLISQEEIEAYDKALASAFPDGDLCSAVLAFLWGRNKPRALGRGETRAMLRWLGKSSIAEPTKTEIAELVRLLIAEGHYKGSGASNA